VLDLLYQVGNSRVYEVVMAFLERVPRPLTVSESLKKAKGAEDSHEVSIFLEGELQSVYRRIEAQPDRYIMSKEEYSVLNYFKDRWGNNHLCQQAVFRFWKEYEAPTKAATSSTTLSEVTKRDGPYVPPPGYLGPDSRSKVLQTSLQGLLLCSRFSLTRPGRC